MTDKIVPNDVYKYEISLDFDLDVFVYVDKGSFDQDENKVQESYFTQDKVDELKEQFIKKIRDLKNPFKIFCIDEDEGYNVTEEMIFKTK